MLPKKREIPEGFPQVSAFIDLHPGVNSLVLSKGHSQVDNFERNIISLSFSSKYSLSINTENRLVIVIRERGEGIGEEGKLVTKFDVLI